MIDRLADLEGRVQSARAALEGLAERAARLRARLEARAEADGPPEPQGTSLVVPDIDPPGASTLASSLDRLSQTAWVTASSTASEGDDGRLVSDAWEIALISEEGK